MGNFCARFSVSWFGRKKSKVFWRNKEDLTESIVRLRDDGSICVDALPTARIVPNLNHKRDNVYTRNGGKVNFGNAQPAEAQSLELVSIPLEDQTVKRPVCRKMDVHHFNVALRSSLPPPIPPRKVEQYTCPAVLTMETEQRYSNVSKLHNTETASASEDKSCVQENATGKCDEMKEIPTNICLRSEDSVQWAPPIPSRAFEIATRVDVTEGSIVGNGDLTSVPPIPPRHF